jgi:hypothetical protein
VVILGVPHSVTDALNNFHHLWFFSASMAAASGLAVCFLARGRQRIDGATTTGVESTRTS